MSDCEELVGLFIGDDGVVLEGYSIDVTPYRLADVPGVLEVHVVPSGDVRIVPEMVAPLLPTTTKSPLP